MSQHMNQNDSRPELSDDDSLFEINRPAPKEKFDSVIRGSARSIVWKL